MPQLLLELFSEEIPARMQAKAEADLKKAVVDGLVAAGLGADGRADGNWAVTSMSGPRRLAVCVDGLAARSADVEEERKGPKVGAPEQAVAGFLRGAGLSDISEAEVRSDPKKGDFYVAVRKIEGRETSAIVAELVPEIVRGFHWPKSMRTGTGELRWVRPLQRILCVFDGQVVDFEIDGVASGDLTEGHRVHGRGPFKVSDLDSYVSALGGEGHVMLTRDARRTKIEADAEAVCAAAGLQLVEDKGLLEEVVGLAEWPQVVLGDMDPAFLELPPEVIQLSMRTHQKYFAVRDKTGQLAPHFVVVANIHARDGGLQIAAGNRKVLSARLDDGRFFWDNDKKTGLEAMAPKLATIKFKDELGSIGDKVERVAALARELAPTVGADPDLAERAARLCKADLVSEMVYEFPELQGVMGRYYALEAGEDAKVADAIRDHYKPQGPSDAVPTDPVGIAVALADKLDTLVGFWAIDEKPTGSKDPFALRRAALGVVRIVLENEIPMWLHYSTELHAKDIFSLSSARASELASELDAFFEDRLVVALRDSGQRHDLVSAAIAIENSIGGGAIFTRTVKRVEALGAFLDSEDGVNLLAGYKRAANILKAEEKKDGTTFEGAVNESLLEAAEEKALFKALSESRAAADHALKAEKFAEAMQALAKLRAPVDKFFENVTVNADDSEVRQNRLLILVAIRDALHRVADFSQISG